MKFSIKTRTGSPKYDLGKVEHEARKEGDKTGVGNCQDRDYYGIESGGTQCLVGLNLTGLGKMMTWLKTHVQDTWHMFITMSVDKCLRAPPAIGQAAQAC